ncbi:hypothetical protein HOY34_01505 [Xinfangfangia sp. D13-10-4-6]|uniref:hypothetical protein n=1 Tax=Pseudogemmobacter hezensis TaxID=2737662 RepID=UPI001556EDD2|nr:hypothetical protein [Pseudogemmobacter hezensis]NPD13874.1 hypothetical protein [Pseudogemmobacter hezensis]
MVAGHLTLSVAFAVFVLMASVIAGHPPLAWIFAYSLAGITALISLTFLRLRGTPPL